MTTSRRIIPVHPLIKTSGVRLNGATSGIRRTTGLPAPGPLTMAAWVRVVVDQVGALRYIFSNSASGGADYCELGWQGDNSSSVEDAGGLTQFSVGMPVNGSWFYAALVNGSGGASFRGLWARLNQQFQKTTPRTDRAFTPVSLDVGAILTNAATIEVANLRVWKRVLSETELYAEMYSPFAVSRKALDTDILGYGDMRNRAPGGEWTYTAVSGGTVVTPVSSDEIWFPKRLTVLAAGNASITNVSPSVLYEGLTNIVITGTGFGATQGTKTVYLDDKLQSIVSWTDTTITFNAVSPNLWNNARLLQVRGT